MQDPLNPEPYTPDVSAVCPACDKAHYDDRYTNCVGCGAILWNTHATATISGRGMTQTVKCVSTVQSARSYN